MQRILATVCENCRAQFCNMQRVTHRPRTSFSPICHCLVTYHFDEIFLYMLCLHALYLTQLQDFNCFWYFFFGVRSMICISFHIFFFLSTNCISENVDCKCSKEQMSSKHHLFSTLMETVAILSV